MSRRTRITIVFVSVCAFVVSAMSGTVQGTPSRGTSKNNNCNACHTTIVTGRMEVTGEDSVTDLGTQLDGNVRGALKTYKVFSGGVVTLSVHVIDGNTKFACQIKDFEKPGRRDDASNVLIWSPANEGGNIWTRHEVTNPPYFTKDNGANGGISGSVSPITYTFDLLIDSGTLADVYELVYAVPGLIGNNRVYQEEHFYIEVLSVVDLNDDGMVDFGDFAIFAESAYNGGELDVRGLAGLAEHWLEDSRLAGHWKLDEEAGGIAADSAGENDGTLHGDPNWAPTGGSVGGAIELDGIDDYVSTDFVLDPADGAFSVFAWVKGGAAEQVVISQVGATGRSWLGADSEGKLMTDIRAAAGRLFGPPLISDFLITDGDWHRIGLVWDGSYRHLYSDGEEVAADITDQTGLVSADGGLYFGGEKALSATGFFDGAIDDIRIYDEAVTP